MLLNLCSLLPCQRFALYIVWSSTANDQFLFFSRVIITLCAVLFHHVLVGQPFQMFIILVYLS